MLLAEELILQLHPMDLLLHGDDLSLTNGWVQSILHLFFKLVLALPEQNLLLSINDVNQDVTLLLLELRDLVLQLDGLVLHLLELLLELHLDVEVVVGELLLPLVVLVDHIVQLVHLEDLVLLGNLQLSDLLVVRLDVVVDADLLLLQDGLLSPEVVVLRRDLGLFFLALDQSNLVGDPVLLHVGRLVVHLLHLLLNVVAVVLVWTLEVIAVTAALKLSALPVQTIDLESLLLNLEESLLDLLLDLLDVFLLFLELTDQVLKLSLEHLVLGRSVQVIKTDTRDLISVVLNLDLLLGDVLVGHLCLLEQISRGFLNRLLL